MELDSPFLGSASGEAESFYDQIVHTNALEEAP